MLDIAAIDEAFEECCKRYDEAQAAWLKQDRAAFETAKVFHEMAVLRFHALRGEITVQ